MPSHFRRNYCFVDRNCCPVSSYCWRGVSSEANRTLSAGVTELSKERYRGLDLREGEVVFVDPRHRRVFQNTAVRNTIGADEMPGKAFMKL